MPERRFDTAYWNEPFIMELPLKAKLLYIYLWTNVHCNQAGLYEIALKTISFEADLPIEEIPKLLKLLEKKVTWLPEQNLIWVKNFLHRQTKSPTFLAAAAKCLEAINNNGLVQEVIAYNKQYTLSIPYQYPSDKVEVSPSSSSLSHAYTSSLSDKGGGLGEGQVTEEDQEIISAWGGVKGFVMELSAMVELLKKIRTDFPDVDILSESRRWAVSKLAHPLGKGSNPSNQIYNFMEKRHVWNKEKGGRKPRKGEYDAVMKLHDERARSGKSIHEMLHDE